MVRTSLWLFLTALLLVGCAKEEMVESTVENTMEESNSAHDIEPTIATDALTLETEVITLSVDSDNESVQIVNGDRTTILYDGIRYVAEDDWELLQTPSYVLYKKGDAACIWHGSMEYDTSFNLQSVLPVPLSEFEQLEGGTYSYIKDENDGMVFYRNNSGQIVTAQSYPEGLADDDKINKVTKYTVTVSDSMFVIDIKGWQSKANYVVTPAYSIPSLVNPDLCQEVSDEEILHILNGGS